MRDKIETGTYTPSHAPMAGMVDAADLKSATERCAGSSPARGTMSDKKWPDDFRVMQTFNELGTLVYETVLDELLDDDPYTSHSHTDEEFLWAEPIAKKVRDRFLMNLDGE